MPRCISQRLISRTFCQLNHLALVLLGCCSCALNQAARLNLVAHVNVVQTRRKRKCYLENAEGFLASPSCFTALAKYCLRWTPPMAAAARLALAAARCA